MGQGSSTIDPSKTITIYLSPYIETYGQKEDLSFQGLSALSASSAFRKEIVEYATTNFILQRNRSVQHRLKIKSIRPARGGHIVVTGRYSKGRSANPSLNRDFSNFTTEDIKEGFYKATNAGEFTVPRGYLKFKDIKVEQY